MSETIKKVIIFSILVCCVLNVFAQQERFCIAKDGSSCDVVVDENDWAGVI